MTIDAKFINDFIKYTNEVPKNLNAEQIEVWKKVFSQSPEVEWQEIFEEYEKRENKE